MTNDPTCATLNHSNFPRVRPSRLEPPSLCRIQVQSAFHMDLHKINAKQLSPREKMNEACTGYQMDSPPLVTRLLHSGFHYFAKRSDIGRHIARDLKMYVNTFRTKMRQSCLFKYMHKLVVGSIAANRSGEDVV